MNLRYEIRNLTREEMNEPENQKLVECGCTPFKVELNKESREYLKALEEVIGKENVRNYRRERGN